MMNIWNDCVDWLDKPASNWIVLLAVVVMIWAAEIMRRDALSRLGHLAGALGAIDQTMKTILGILGRREK